MSHRVEGAGVRVNQFGIEALEALPGEVVGGACIIDRSGGRADVGCELVSLASVNFPDFDADDLPPELALMPAVKPGSRGLAR